MDRKIVMGVAAVAGIGLLLYLRKSGDSSTIAGAGTLMGAAAAANNWATQPIVINTKAPPVVADTTAKSPAPAPAPAPAASSGGAGWGPGYPASSSTGGGYLDQKTGIYHYSDGSTYQNPNYGTADKPKWSLTGAEVASFWG